MLAAASATFFSAVSFTAEPLLACVVAGLVTTNRRWPISLLACCINLLSSIICRACLFLAHVPFVAVTDTYNELLVRTISPQRPWMASNRLGLHSAVPGVSHIKPSSIP